MFQKPPVINAVLAMTNLPARLTVIMLLVCYLVAFVLSPAGAPHVHHEDELHVADSCHKDACHISMYHPGDQNGCDHKFHFSEALPDCDLCHSTLPRQDLAKEASFPLADLVFSIACFASLDNTAGETFIKLTNRGPPHLL